MEHLTGFTKDWKDHVNETLHDHAKAVAELRAFRSWFLGVALGMGIAVGKFGPDLIVSALKH